MIIYFSGTGNSRYAARMMAAGLGDELTDAGAYIKENKKAEFYSRRPWVFTAPTYAWQLPHIFRDFIKKGSFMGNRDAYFVMTCGMDTGNAAAKVKKLCREVGFHYKGVLSVVMPENYIAMFNAPDREEAKKIIEAAQPILQEGIGRIQKGKLFASNKINLPDKLKSGPVNWCFYRFAVRTKPFYTTDACIGCGACQRACVLNNICLVDGNPIWGEDCTHCMSCICGCPQNAIEYGKKSKRKPRYQCEEYRG